MDASTKRNSRWTRDPVIGDDGKPHVARLSERDIEVFKVLARYPFLPADYIHAFVGGSFKALIHRLNLLTRKPNLYISRPERQRQNANANYRYLVYELDTNGARVLHELGVPVPPSKPRHNFAHELMTSMVMANFELGIRKQSHFRLISWDDIQAHPNFPPSTKDHDRPNAIGGIIADWEPFGIERPHANAKGYVFCPGIEADTGSEPVTTSDDMRSSIVKKLIAYLDILRNKTHQRAWGVSFLVVPFVTISQVRAESFLKLISRMTDGRGHPQIIVTTMPSFYSFERPLKPDGSMLTRNWQRAGYPPFSFTEGGDHGRKADENPRPHQRA